MSNEIACGVVGLLLGGRPVADSGRRRAAGSEGWSQTWTPRCWSGVATHGASRQSAETGRLLRSENTGRSRSPAGIAIGQRTRLDSDRGVVANAKTCRVEFRELGPCV